MKLNRVILLVLCVVLSFGLMSCDSTKKTNSKVLATVNGVEVTQGLVTAMAAITANLQSGMQMKYSEIAEDVKKEFETNIFIYVVDIEAIRIDYSEQEVEVITPDFEEALDAQVDYVMEQFTGAVGADEMKKCNITEETVRYYYEAQIYDAKFKDDVAMNDPIPEEELQDYYDKNQSLFFTTSDAVETSHILMGDPSHKEEDREAAEAVRKKALDGEDFAELAREYSTDTASAAVGGSVGYADENSTLVKPYVDAMLALEIGEISDIVETEFGFHIIKATNIRKAGQQEYEDVKNIIESQLILPRYTKGYEQVRDRVTIVWADDVEIDPETKLPKFPESEESEVEESEVEDDDSSDESDSEESASETETE